MGETGSALGDIFDAKFLRKLESLCINVRKLMLGSGRVVMRQSIRRGQVLNLPIIRSIFPEMISDT